MILGKTMFIPSEINFYPQLDHILTNEFGLVNAAEHEGKEKILVWEWEGIGRYQVRYRARAQILEKDYDECIFRYWLSKDRLCREVVEKDPMRPAIERIVAEAKGAILPPDQLYDMEKPLETVLSWIG